MLISHIARRTAMAEIDTEITAYETMREKLETETWGNGSLCERGSSSECMSPLTPRLKMLSVNLDVALT